MLGAVVVLATQASGTSTISGVMFKDTNRNGVQDPGEVVMPEQYLYLYDADTGAYIRNALTDISGAYRFDSLASGNYKIIIAPISWNSLRQNWVPTTANDSVRPEIRVTLAATATANFGIREIIRSTDSKAPISSHTGADGMKAESFNDVVTAKEVYDRVHTGTLIGKEAPDVTVRLDITSGGITNSLTVYSNGVPVDYRASSSISWLGWLAGGNELFHEYGHAWSGYYSKMILNDPELVGYQKARGIYADPRVNSSYCWKPGEMIAEDYKQLFGSPDAQGSAQCNREVPLAKDVPGLKEYLSGAFRQSPADAMAPSVPTNVSGKALSQSQIQLSWTASTDNKGVTSYQVFRNGTLAGSVNAPSTTFADANLNPGTSYQYYVKAVDAANNISGASQTVTVTTLPIDTQAPSAPTNVKASGATSNSISLTWSPSTDNVGVVEYKIYQVGGRKSSTQTLLNSVSGTSFTAPNLKPNTSYYFYVVAVDAAGNESLPSSTLAAKTRR